MPVGGTLIARSASRTSHSTPTSPRLLLMFRTTLSRPNASFSMRYESYNWSWALPFHLKKARQLAPYLKESQKYMDRYVSSRLKVGYQLQVIRILINDIFRPMTTPIALPTLLMNGESRKITLSTASLWPLREWVPTFILIWCPKNWLWQTESNT